MPTRLPPARLARLPFTAPAGAGSRSGRSAVETSNTRASGRLRPWTMRRLPAALNPNVWAGIRAGEHAASPSRMHSNPVAVVRMRAACGEAALRGACARRVRLPLRGQHRLARLRRRQAPCFPFNCAHRSGAREHQNACECRRRCGERQGKTGRRARFRRTAARGRTPRTAVRAGGPLCYRSAAFGARMRIPCMQLNGKQEADRRPACAVPATVRRPRDALPRARAHAAHDATARPPGGKAAAWQAASPDTGRRKGRARCSPNARSAGDGSSAHSARVRAGFVRSVMLHLSAGRRPARLPVSTVSTRCAPCRAR